MTDRDAIEREAEARVVRLIQASADNIEASATGRAPSATKALELAAFALRAVAEAIARREHLRGGGE